MKTIAFCPKCGNQLDDGVNFCQSCGNPVGDVQPQAQEEYSTAKGLFGDAKHGGISVKSKFDNFVHGEGTEMEKPEGAIYFINGLQGTLAVYEDYIELNFTGNLIKKVGSGLGGVKKIYYHQINSIQKKDATELINGTIEFEVPGMASSGWGKKTENYIKYLPKYQEEVDKICDFVNDKILSIHNANSQPTQVVQNEVSPMAKLKEAKELLDMGVISQEEFDEIKAKCIAQM